MNNNNYFIFIFLVLVLIGILYFKKYNEYENFNNYNLVDMYAVRKNENCDEDSGYKKKSDLTNDKIQAIEDIENRDEGLDNTEYDFCYKVSDQSFGYSINKIEKKKNK